VTDAELIRELELLAADIERQRDHLRQMWIDVMITNEGINESDLPPLVQLQRRELIEAAALLDHARASHARLLDQARGRAAVQAALRDLVSRVGPKPH
jgi:hypothetical protein